MNAAILEMFRYCDWADERLLTAAAAMTDAQLDQAFDIGRGTLRKTLIHIASGNAVWLSRWQGRVETPWPDENAAVSVAELSQRVKAAADERRGFLESLREADAGRPMKYRDSKGSLFSTTLGQMVLQGAFHATHHRAQAVNLLRRLGAGLVELDYMMTVRRPAPQ